MKSFVLALGILLPTLAFAQSEPRTILLGETQFEFTGARTFFEVEIGEEYYHLENGVLFGYEIGYMNYEKMTYIISEVNISDLNLKEARIEKNDPINGFDAGYNLYIDTKKTKPLVKWDTRTTLFPEESIEMMPFIAITFQSKESAEKALSKINAAAAKK